MATSIARHKTAMRRREPSKPIRLALEHDLINSNSSVLDYGCGHGVDVNFLRSTGVHCIGWDPVHRPEGQLVSAEVVNLGYVVNVIEDGTERQQTLRRAWELATNLLVVSGRLDHERRTLRSTGTYEDGVVTSRGTFQKFYDQHELRQWIEGCLGEPAIPAAPGIFYVFRSAEQREEYVARLFRRRTPAPRLRKSEGFYQENVEAFAPLLDFMSERGRPPNDGEVELSDLIERAGTLKRAISVVTRVFGQDHWAAAAAERKADLVVYLALAKFGTRPRSSDVSAALRNDAKAFFGSYKTACSTADALLFETGSRPTLEAAMSEARIGKLTPTALYVHHDYLGLLPPVLRTYEGCARSLAGDVPEANIIKLARDKYQISYLCYPDFDGDPHPALDHSVVVKLQDLAVRYRFYDDPAGNPPVLHRKETLISPSDPRYGKFRRLTEQEERWGLLEGTTQADEREDYGTPAD